MFKDRGYDAGRYDHTCPVVKQHGLLADLHLLRPAYRGDGVECTSNFGSLPAAPHLPVLVLEESLYFAVSLDARIICASEIAIGEVWLDMAIGRQLVGVNDVGGGARVHCSFDANTFSYGSDDVIILQFVDTGVEAGWLG